MNIVCLYGRLTKDPEVRYDAKTQTVATARFTLAVDRGKKNGESLGTDFIPCICVGKTAEVVEKYVKKGHPLLVNGRVHVGSYDRDGRKVSSTDIFVDRVEFTGSANAASKPLEEKKQETNTFAGFDIGDLDLPF